MWEERKTCLVQLSLTGQWEDAGRLLSQHPRYSDMLHLVIKRFELDGRLSSLKHLGQLPWILPCRYQLLYNQGWFMKGRKEEQERRMKGIGDAAGVNMLLFVWPSKCSERHQGNENEKISLLFLLTSLSLCSWNWRLENFAAPGVFACNFFSVRFQSNVYWSGLGLKLKSGSTLVGKSSSFERLQIILKNTPRPWTVWKSFQSNDSTS